MPALTPEQARRVYDRIARAQDWQRFYEDAATADLVAHAGFDDARCGRQLRARRRRRAINARSWWRASRQRY